MRSDFSMEDHEFHNSIHGISCPFRLRGKLREAMNCYSICPFYPLNAIILKWDPILETFSETLNEELGPFIET